MDNVKQLCDLAWAAGWIEGEGNFCLHQLRKDKPCHTVRISGASSDRDIIERIQAVFGCGGIRAQPPTGLGRKMLWIWSVQDKPNVSRVGQQLLPYLGERRKAALMRLLDYIEKNPNTKVRRKVQQ